MPNLLILSGLPGSGKTTLGQALLNRRLYTHLISSDIVRLALNPHPTYTVAESEEVFRRVHAKVSYLLSVGFDVVVDATNTRMKNINPLITIAKHLGAGLYVVCVEAPKEERVQRILKRTYPEPHGTIKASEKMEKYIDLDPEVVSLWLDGTQPVEELVSLVQGVVNFNHE